MTTPEDEAGDLHRRQMRGFKDFYQFTVPTRVIAGRDLLGGMGFELTKEGAERVAVITDAVIRGTGLVDRVVAGIEDGGLEVAAIFDGVPPDSDSAVVVGTSWRDRHECLIGRPPTNRQM